MACNESRTAQDSFCGLGRYSPEGQIQINAWATHRAPTRNSSEKASDVGLTSEPSGSTYAASCSKRTVVSNV